MKESGHPLIVVVEYLCTRVSTHLPTVVPIDSAIHSSASHGTPGPGPLCFGPGHFGGFETLDLLHQSIVHLLELNT